MQNKGFVRGKYGVEDYLLKPLKQEELTGILLRLKEKMGQEAALEFQLKRSDPSPAKAPRSA